MLSALAMFCTEVIGIHSSNIHQVPGSESSELNHQQAFLQLVTEGILSAVRLGP